MNEFVEECRREWRRLGVPDPIANEMAADLTADIARERGSEWADIARERGGEFGELAYERGSELAETARERGGELAHRGRVKARHWH